ncbi:MAG: AMP-dependent synthetase/ligase [Flavobacteriaceae bacterium]|nr:AMP-dependent synthetase/ligase [Flavobacteriaceae bacterium]
MRNTVTRLFDLPYYQLEHFPQQRMFNTKKQGKWESLSTEEFLEQVQIAGNALLHLGVQPGDKIALVTTANRIEWHILDIALLQIGAISVPLYATLSEKDYEYILNHSGASYCFVSDEELHQKVSRVQSRTEVKVIYGFALHLGSNDWKRFMDMGASRKQQDLVEEHKGQIQENDLATIIYTSGTTGIPKGVMISHESLVFTTILCKDIINLQGAGKKVMSYLPVSHIFERLVGYYYMYMGFEIYFAESLEKLIDNLQEVQPNFIPIVPRLLEKIFDKIIARGHVLKGLKKSLFFWAVNLADKYDINGKNSWIYLQKLAIADKLVFRKWRQVFGGKMELMVSGSAPLQARLIQIFAAAGLPICEGYGMTESSGVITLNDFRNNQIRINTVGKAVKGLKVKIAQDGEILIKGKSILRGYYKEPEETAQAIQNGYFHTGDIGEICDEGFLKITDRKKEIFKTSGGKYIAPSPIENRFKQSSFIEQIIVIGEGRKMPAALIQVNQEFVNEWARLHNHKIVYAYNDEKLIARIQQEVDKVNEDLGNWEKIKRFEITEDEWTVEAGHLTPSLKPRRKAIKEKYAHLFDKIYGDL